MFGQVLVVFFYGVWIVVDVGVKVQIVEGCLVDFVIVCGYVGLYMGWCWLVGGQLGVYLMNVL